MMLSCQHSSLRRDIALVQISQSIISSFLISSINIVDSFVLKMHLHDTILELASSFAND